jgi:hypothetical protein
MNLIVPPPGRAVSLPGVALRTREPLRQRGEGGLGPLSPSLGGPGTCSTPSGIEDRNPSHTLDAISSDRISTTTRLARCSVSNVRAQGACQCATIRGSPGRGSAMKHCILIPLMALLTGANPAFGFKRSTSFLGKFLCRSR